MNKKFIISLTILTLLFSCRESEEIIGNGKINETVLKKESKSENYDLENNYNVVEDSAKSSSIVEEDPPVKYGGHWRH